MKKSLKEARKHFCVFEINKKTKKHRLVDEFGENYTAADEMCRALNNFREPEWPIYFCLRCLDDSEFEHIENYVPFIETIVYSVNN